MQKKFNARSAIFDVLNLAIIAGFTLLATHKPARADDDVALITLQVAHAHACVSQDKRTLIMTPAFAKKYAKASLEGRTALLEDVPFCPATQNMMPSNFTKAFTFEPPQR